MWIWRTEKAVIPIRHNWVDYTDGPLEEEEEDHPSNFHPLVLHFQKASYDIGLIPSRYEIGE